MKTLKGYSILYDNDCPACSAYTKAFVSTGMLEQEGRQPFSEADQCQSPNVDWHRACNEIAVIDNNDGKVSYGVDGLVIIIAHNFKWVATAFQFGIVKYLLEKLYFFISFNRKVIAPGKEFEGENSCTPDMNLTYRWAYIAFCWLITSLILVNYSTLLVPIVPRTNLIREFVICGGQIIFQGAAVLMIGKERAIHYLGNMMTISLLGALLLTPMLVIHHWIKTPELFLIYFLMVVGGMIFEHKRRSKVLGLPLVMTGTWVLYRLIVLLITL